MWSSNEGLRANGMMRRRDRYFFRSIVDWIQAQFVFFSLRVLRLISPSAGGAIASRLFRLIGPLTSRQKVGMDNLRLAFAEKDDRERRAILRGMWDNLARTAVEYVHLDSLFEFDFEHPAEGRVEVVGVEHLVRLREENKAAIIFTGHLANWELLALCLADFKLGVTSLYRAPNNRFIAERVSKMRSATMGDLIAAERGAARKLMAVLKRGGNLGILVDQRLRTEGAVVVPFFGHPARTNPLAARLARMSDCAVYGCRAIRLPGGRFRLEFTDEIDLPRDARGKVDIEAATARMANIVEGWVRDHPEQWLWVHRRWKM